MGRLVVILLIITFLPFLFAGKSVFAGTRLRS
jgi:hypothetical protein